MMKERPVLSGSVRGEVRQPWGAFHILFILVRKCTGIDVGQVGLVPYMNPAAVRVIAPGGPHKYPRKNLKES